MLPETGPFLKAALVCGDVIEAKDGVLSLIRVIDRLIVTAAGPEAPTEMPPVPQRLKIVLMFVSGRARGTHPVELRIEKPDGNIESGWMGSVFLEGEDRGANVIIDIQTEFTSEGLYWFQVYFEAEQLTKIPFRLIYQRVGPATALP